MYTNVYNTDPNAIQKASCVESCQHIQVISESDGCVRVPEKMTMELVWCTNNKTYQKPGHLPRATEVSIKKVIVNL